MPSNINYNPIWVAYVTTGYEEYEFETKIIGTFTKRYLACQAVFEYLCETSRIFGSGYEDPSFTEKEKQTVSTDMMKRTRSAPRFLEESVNRYKNSFYKIEWDYAVEKQTVCNSRSEEKEEDDEMELIEDELVQSVIESSLKTALTEEEQMIANVNSARSDLGIQPFSFGQDTPSQSGFWASPDFPGATSIEWHAQDENENDDDWETTVESKSGIMSN
jgi:hypothetical protein